MGRSCKDLECRFSFRFFQSSPRRDPKRIEPHLPEPYRYDKHLQCSSGRSTGYRRIVGGKNNRHSRSSWNVPYDTFDYGLVLNVHAGGWLVQQKHFWCAGQRPCNGDPLSLASGEPVRRPIGKIPHSHAIKAFHGNLLFHGCRFAAHLEPISHVF